MNRKKRLFIMLAAMLMFVVLMACDGSDRLAGEVVSPTESAAESDLTYISGELFSPEVILQLQSEARYAFEQIFLPTVIYDSSKEEVTNLLNMLDVSGMEELLLDSWVYLVDAFIDFSVTDGILAAPVSRDVLGLGDEHILDISVERLTENTPVFIISMLDIQQLLRSTYVAIVYHDKELQIYTLEQGDDFHMFSFVNLHSRGSFFEVENDRDAFIEAIVSVLDEDVGG